MPYDVTLREVGPRDGLQLIDRFIATEHKLAWCRDDVAAGVREIEVTSFVPPAIVPQFADAADVAAGAVAIAGLTRSALVPNMKGAQRAFAAGIGKVNYVLSASQAHNMANVRRTTEQSVEDFTRLAQARTADGIDAKVVGGIATAFGCTIQGAVPEVVVFRVLEQLLAAGADEIIIADTVGYANPAQVRRILREAKGLCGDKPLFAHFHDTRGLGLANVLAALDCGVVYFDASLGGLGGCPFAPGASGNICLEDCAFMLEAMGLRTGIDIPQLLEIRQRMLHMLPDDAMTGSIARAGLPKAA